MRNSWLRFVPLFCIILIAGFLRLYQLGVTPPSPDWDEAALGYNAYSILKTGKDEYGNLFPLSIRSFDDYKPPLYTYLTVPSVGIFGLNTWSTRLPSALMGILAVIGTYFLVMELFSLSKNIEQRTKNQELSRNKELRTKNLSLLSALLLAISPWHIQFSRIAFEANTGITLNIWAVVFFLKGLSKKKYLSISAFLFGIGMYAYHSQRVFIPLLCLLLFFIYRKVLFTKENRRSIMIAFVIGLLTIAPLFTVLFNKTAMLRLRGTSSFTDQTGLLARNISKLEQDQASGDKVGELLDNRRFVFAKTIFSGYLSHFSLKWLFLTGDNPRHHAPDMGLLYPWELPFLLFGILMLLRSKTHDRTTILLVGWMLVAPIAAAPTTGLPHAIRTLVFLPTFQIFTAFGIIELIQQVKQMSKNTRLIGYSSLFFISLFAIFNFAYYLVQYFVVMNREYSEYWQYGYKEAVAYTESVKNSYEKIVVSTGLEQSYMFYLFYTQYDPIKYLSGGGTKSGGFAENRNSFGKYVFRPLDWKNETFDDKTLYVGSPSEMPHGNNMHIKFLNGVPSIEIKDRKD